MMKSEIERNIRDGASKDGQFAIAYAILELAEVISRASGVNHEIEQTFQKVGGEIASALGSLSTSIESGCGLIADALPQG